MIELMTVRRCRLAAYALALIITGIGPASALPARTEAQQDQGAQSFNSNNPRDAAVHDCSVAADKWSMMSWQATQLQVYGECMDEHRQPE